MGDEEGMPELPKLSTPALVPWIPPGKPKESTFNAFAHKKNEVGILNSFKLNHRCRDVVLWAEGINEPGRTPFGYISLQEILSRIVQKCHFLRRFERPSKHWLDFT